jgi:hypothetical protein
MTITRVLNDCIGDIIDGVSFYYDRNELLDMTSDDDIVEVVACLLKVNARRSVRSSNTIASDRTRKELNEVDVYWINKAQVHIRKYVQDNYLSDESDEE